MYFVKLDYDMCSTTKATFEMICNKKMIAQVMVCVEATPE
jgi:hypothetical protein